MPKIDDTAIREIVTGRVVPYIYSFETNTLPNYLKVGDTYRPVEERLKEWRYYYKDLKEVSRHKAVVNNDIFFRDYSVHKYLEQNGAKNVRLNPQAKVFSKEFFEGASETMVTAAVSDIAASYQMPGKYDYYSYSNMKQVVEQYYPRTQELSLRDNQKEAIRKFKAALKAGRTNLLMYAVMRFGKTVTALRCAQEMGSKLTVVVSAKADVADEWKRAVESDKALAGYRFMNSDDLKRHPDVKALYSQLFNKGDGEDEVCTHIVLFLTLQDLAGSTKQIKTRHQILQHADVGLLIIDETHFGAHAPILGKILAGTSVTKAERKKLKAEKEDLEDLGDPNKLEAIRAKVKLHLSGTPYRILMKSEFEEDDIVAFIQFSDVYEAKLQWAKDRLEEETNEWDNPYYGFPEMIRFAFNPNESSRKVLEKVPGSKPSELLKTAHADATGDRAVFIYKQEVLDLLQVLDGSKDDDALLGLLGNDAIKAGKLARHVVMPLPSRAACDALERLITDHKDQFKNLAGYKIINVSGIHREYKDTSEAKAAIESAENRHEKTLTLTVNRMLTGVTVPQWDTMIYLKGTMSPQEYDQAVFRLQSPWIKTYTDGEGKDIKYDMKPQTLLVDLYPARMFSLQEYKAYVNGYGTRVASYDDIEKSIERDLRISPIITLNANNHKLEPVTATNIIDAVRRYSNDKSIKDEVNEIGIAVSLQDDPEIRSIVARWPEFGNSKGLTIKPVEGGGQELDGEDVPGNAPPAPNAPTENTPSKADDTDTSFEKKIKTLYAMILLFAFLSTTEEKSLEDVIRNLDANDDNRRIARNLGLRKDELQLLQDKSGLMDLRNLNYKINNSGYRASDLSLTAEEHINAAINKFKRLSESEIFTPSCVVDKMYDAFDKDFWANIRSVNVLDIASKSGSFARGFVARVRALGVNGDEIKDNFYSIPTSSVAYEFTRKMYQALGLNIDNIASHFTSYDLLNNTETRISNLLALGKKFCDITVADLDEDATITDKQSEGSVKFAAVVGNPPYDEQAGGAATDRRPLYHLFVDAAIDLQPNYVCLIHPARFLFDAGKTPKEWNRRILNDPHLHNPLPLYEPDSQKIFDGVDIKGGVCIILWDKNQTSGGLGGKFVAHNELRTTLEKVGTGGMDMIVSTAGGSPTKRYEDKYGRRRSYFRTSAFFDLPDAFTENPDAEHTVKIVGLAKGNKRTERYVSRDMMNDPNLENWKVFLPKSNGSGALGEVLSTPLVGEPFVGCTESFVQIGAFKSQAEAENCMKYIRSKFVRAMLGTLKITQDNPKSTWRNVPLQDFTDKSDIDWSKSIAEIDEQLFDKYGLTEDERTFIKTRVKAME